LLCAGACGDDDDDNRDGGRGGTGGSGGRAGGSGGGGGTGGGGTGGGGGGGTGGATDARTEGGADTAGGDASGDASMMLTDAQVAGVMLEANTGEVHTSEVADAKTQNMAVRMFATKMKMEHTAANTRLIALIQRIGIAAADSPLRAQLDREAMQALDMLWPLSGAAFDRAYLQVQVMMHMRVLALLDSTLIPSAQNAELKTELQAARTAVTAHLAEAQTLLSTTSDGGVDGPGADGAGADGGADAASADAPAGQ
jgi:putative membrane protein